MSLNRIFTPALQLAIFVSLFIFLCIRVWQQGDEITALRSLREEEMKTQMEYTKLRNSVDSMYCVQVKIKEAIIHNLAGCQDDN